MFIIMVVLSLSSINEAWAGISCRDSIKRQTREGNEIRLYDVNKVTPFSRIAEKGLGRIWAIIKAGRMGIRDYWDRMSQSEHPVILWDPIRGLDIVYQDVGHPKDHLPSEPQVKELAEASREFIGERVWLLAYDGKGLIEVRGVLKKVITPRPRSPDPYWPDRPDLTGRPTLRIHIPDWQTWIEQPIDQLLFLGAP